MVGADDPGTPVAAAQAIHERIAGSRLVVIPSASHLCNIEQAEVFNQTWSSSSPRPTAEARLQKIRAASISLKNGKGFRRTTK